MGHVGLVVWQPLARSLPPEWCRRRLPSFALEALEGRYFFSVQLDPTFGQGGHAYGPAPVEAGGTVRPIMPYQAIAVQADGAILVAGDYDVGDRDHPRFTIRRFRPDGTLDPTFDAGPARDDYVPYLLIQPDGKILVVGTESVERLRPDGSHDPTYRFEKPPSLEDFSADDPLFWEFENPALMPDGDLVGAVGSYSSETLIRFNPDGSEDRTFGDGGDVTLPDSAWAESIAPTPGGELLVAADGWDADGNSISLLYRLDRFGQPDPAFGDAGGVRLPADEVWRGYADHNGGQIIAREPDGSAIVGLCDVLDSGHGHNYLVRVRPDGSLDPDFGDHGEASITESGSLPIGLLRQPDGRLLVTCSFPDAPAGRRDILIVAFRPDGSRDESFGEDGVFRTPANYVMPRSWEWLEMVPKIAPQGDGGDLILLYGDGSPTHRDPGQFFHLARLHATDPAAGGPAATPLTPGADEDDGDPSPADDPTLYGAPSDDLDWEADEDALWN